MQQLHSQSLPLLSLQGMGRGENLGTWLGMHNTLTIKCLMYANRLCLRKFCNVFNLLVQLILIIGCKRDKEGYYWITGRTDDCMNVAGHLLSTAQIESALVEHDAVTEAAVVSFVAKI